MGKDLPRDIRATAGEFPSEFPSTQFGDLLRAYRRAAGLTQEALAERAALSAKAISALERGENSAPRRETLQQLMRALRLPAHARGRLEAAARRSDQNTCQMQPPAGAHVDSARLGEAGVPPLVGREAELTLIDEHLRGKTPPVLIVAGEPGIGKTRLLHEAWRRAEVHQLIAVTAECYRRGLEPYAPFPSALDRCLSRLSHHAAGNALDGCNWLVRLLPEVVEAHGVVPPISLPAEQERRLIFKAVARFLTHVAGTGGTLLALDDLQWASADALDLLMSLATIAQDSSLRIVVATHNTDRQARSALWETLTHLVRSGMAHLVELTPLEQYQSQELLKRLLSPTIECTDLPAITERAGGIPFYLVSFAASMQTAGNGRSRETEAPWTVVQSLRQRIVALPGDGTYVLGAAAIIGRQVSLDVLHLVGERAQIAPKQIYSVIDAACRERLLVDLGVNTVQFAHDIIRECAEGNLGPEQRAELHRWTAAAIEAVHPNASPELLAYHYAAGGDRKRAVISLAQVGDRALAGHAHIEAAVAFGELSSHLDALGNVQEAAAARERQGAALMAAAQYNEALDVLERAAAVYAARKDQDGLDGLARTLASIGEVHVLRVTAEEGIARLQATLHSFSSPGPSAQTLAALYLSLAWLINTQGRYGEALPLAQRAAALARMAGDTTVLVQANLRYGHLLLMLHHIDEGIRVLRSVLPQVQSGEDLYSLRFALNNLGWISEARGNFKADQRYTERALGAAMRLDDSCLIAYMRSNHGGPAFNLGQWGSARADFEQGLADMRQLQPSWASAWPPLLLGQLDIAEGRDEEGEGLLSEAIACAAQSSDLQAQRWAHGTLAERELLRGQPEGAAARLEPLIDGDGEQVIDVTALLPVLAWAYGDIGLLDKAFRYVEQAIRRAEAGRLLPALASALRVRGLLSQQQARWDDAKHDLLRALSLARHMHYPYDEAKTLYQLGLLEERSGNRRRARELLGASERILSSLGERLYLPFVQQDIEKMTSH